MVRSAGLVPFRRTSGLELLIAHPGGPFFARRDRGAWSIVKGMIEEGEGILDAALREFTEETGWSVPAAEHIDLGSVTQRGGKTVYASAFEHDFDLSTFRPGTFEMAWRGRLQRFPEIDRVVWASPDDARRALNPAQTRFVDRLQAHLRTIGDDGR